MEKTKMAKNKKLKAAKSGKRSAAKKSKFKPMGKRVMAQFKKVILDQRNDVLKIVRHKEMDLVAQDVGDEADQAAQSLEKEMLFELSDNERNTLDNIEAALRKMEKNTYGLCENCRNPIGLKRLKALPYARYCIVCQSKAEVPQAA